MKTTIIAEAGINHNGDMTIAKRLVDAAAEAGADLVKFQTFKAETLVTKSADKADYQKSLTREGETQFEMIKKLELDEVAHEELIGYCGQQNIQFLSVVSKLIRQFKNHCKTRLFPFFLSILIRQRGME